MEAVNYADTQTRAVWFAQVLPPSNDTCTTSSWQVKPGGSLGGLSPVCVGVPEFGTQRSVFVCDAEIGEDVQTVPVAATLAL